MGHKRKKKEHVFVFWISSQTLPSHKHVGAIIGLNVNTD